MVAQGHCGSPRGGNVHPLVGADLADLALVVMQASRTGSVVASSPRRGAAMRWHDHADMLSGPQKA